LQEKQKIKIKKGRSEATNPYLVSGLDDSTLQQVQLRSWQRAYSRVVARFVQRVHRNPKRPLPNAYSDNIATWAALVGYGVVAVAPLALTRGRWTTDKRRLAKTRVRGHLSYLMGFIRHENV
jgi:hypothetical protein